MSSVCLARAFRRPPPSPSCSAIKLVWRCGFRRVAPTVDEFVGAVGIFTQLSLRRHRGLHAWLRWPSVAHGSIDLKAPHAERVVTALGRPRRAMGYVSTSLRDYAEDVRAACGGDSITAPRSAELDNTKHTESCSLHILPAILAALFILFVLRRLLCKEKLRTLYAGAEDAPELEEMLPAGTTKRVDSHSTGARERPSATAPRRRSASRAPRPKKKRGAEHELEPVLWRKRSILYCTAHA